MTTSPCPMPRSSHVPANTARAFPPGSRFARSSCSKHTCRHDRLRSKHHTPANVASRSAASRGSRRLRPRLRGLRRPRPRLSAGRSGPDLAFLRVAADPTSPLRRLWLLWADCLRRRICARRKLLGLPRPPSIRGARSLRHVVHAGSVSHKSPVELVRHGVCSRLGRPGSAAPPSSRYLGVVTFRYPAAWRAAKKFASATNPRALFLRTRRTAIVRTERALRCSVRPTCVT
jgi:hypothetical protein